MPSLYVRKLDNIVYEQLRIRAVKHGVTLEEEVRQILTHAVKTPERLSAVFSKHFGVDNGIDFSD